MSFKKLILPALCVFSFLAISTGCKKSNNSNNSATITATMGSTSFSSGTANTSTWYSTDSAAFEIGGVNINGKDTSALAIEIFPPFTVGTTISNQSSVDMDYYVSSTQDYWAGFGTGHIAMTVTSQDTVNHKIAGTFTGTLYNVFNSNDSLLVTNGKFNTAYIVQP